MITTITLLDAYVCKAVFFPKHRSIPYTFIISQSAAGCTELLCERMKADQAFHDRQACFQNEKLS